MDSPARNFYLKERFRSSISIIAPDSLRRAQSRLKLPTDHCDIAGIGIVNSAEQVETGYRLQPSVSEPRPVFLVRRDSMQVFY